MDVYKQLLDEETVRGERVAWIFRWILYGVVGCLAAVVYFLQGHQAGLFGMLLSIVPIAYNLILFPLIRRKRTHPWIRYASVTIDVLGLTLYNLVDTLFTSPLVPVTTATLLLYPPVIFLASLRLDRRLIAYATALSLITMNALYAFAQSRFDPAIAAKIVSADALGQVYRSVYVILSGCLMLFIPGTIKRLLENQRDVYEDSRVNYELSRRDILTGIANRRALEQHLEQELAKAARYGTEVAVLYLDLDEFKPINDRFGHEGGDFVLRETVRRLVSAVRDRDLVSRVGGDEFVLVVPLAEAGDNCDSLAERISASVRNPIALGDKEIRVGVSVGVAIFPADATTSGELIARADHRMLEKKKGAR